MPPDSSAGRNCAVAAQPDGVELHQHEVADQARSAGSVCSRNAKGDVLEHRQVGEQRAELEQHADLAPHREQAPRVAGRRTDWPATSDTPGAAARSWPPIRRRIVVLPQPEPPMIATTLPRGIVMSMPREHGRGAVVAEGHAGQLDGVLGRTGRRARLADCGGGH